MATYTKPKLRKRLKREIQAKGKGGKKGQWSARKAQLLTKAYEKAGGGYKGHKDARQISLQAWGDQAGSDSAAATSTRRARQPLAGYDALTIPAVRTALDGASASRRASVARYERAHRNRSTLLAWLERG